MTVWLARITNYDWDENFEEVCDSEVTAWQVIRHTLLGDIEAGFYSPALTEAVRKYLATGGEDIINRFDMFVDVFPVKIVTKEDVTPCEPS